MPPRSTTAPATFRTAALALALVAAPACQRKPPELGSCREPLAGVWTAEADAPLPALPLVGDERLAFDVREEGGGIALYPLCDSARPAAGKTPLATDPAAPPAPLVLSPWRITLTRAGDAAVGTISWRVTQHGRTCQVKQPARLSACQARQARLELTLAGSVDASSCAISAPPTRLTLTLTRQ